MSMPQSGIDPTCCRVVIRKHFKNPRQLGELPSPHEKIRMPERKPFTKHEGEFQRKMRVEQRQPKGCVEIKNYGARHGLVRRPHARIKADKRCPSRVTYELLLHQAPITVHIPT